MDLIRFRQVYDPAGNHAGRYMAGFSREAFEGYSTSLTRALTRQCSR
jgi:hypothetical protein